MKSLVVITGASSGFGKLAAQAFSQAGHPLLLLARRLEKLEELNLPNTLCRKVDVTHLEEMRKAIAEAEKMYGEVDLLINNAGVMLLSDFTKQNTQEWNQMIDVNIKGLLHGLACVSEKMKARKHGTIINISSIAGIKAFEKHVVYCGTKYAVTGISEALRAELSPHNVRVITIFPGAADTELLSHTSVDKLIQEYKSWTSSIGGSMDPQHVVNAMLFAYQAPQNVCIRHIALAATGQVD